MTNKASKQYLSILKWLSNVTAGAGVLVPGYSYFTQFAPPLLPTAGLLTSALAVATITVVYLRRKEPPLPLKLFFFFLVPAIVTLVLYIILLEFCTVVDPQESNRFQIGFGSFDWSLTEKGLQWKLGHPTQTIQEWMLYFHAFKPGGPDLIWKTWTVLLSGALTVVMFVTAFILWTFFWASLAKRMSLRTAQGKQL